MTAQPLNRRGLLAAGTAAAVAFRLPPAASARPATPSSVSDGSLPALLARIASPPNRSDTPGTPFVQRFTYADLQRQLEVGGLRGLDPEIADRDRLREWGDGVEGLWLDDLLVQYALVAELWEAVGFGPADVAQTLSAGDPPSIVRVYRGTFDENAIATALAASGYDERETEHGPVWSIGAGGELDVDHPVGGIVLNAYNNVAVVDGELLVSSPYLTGVEATLAAIAGGAPSLRADRAILDLLAAAGEDLVSAGLLDGAFLSVSGFPERGQANLVPTVVPEQTVPPISLALFGITAGSMPPRSTDPDDPPAGDNDDDTPRSRLVITVQMSSEEEAATAVPLIERRLADGLSVATGQPYADDFDRWEVEASGDGSIVRLVISGDLVARRWRDLILRLDLAFLFTA